MYVTAHVLESITWPQKEKRDFFSRCNIRVLSFNRAKTVCLADALPAFCPLRKMVRTERSRKERRKEDWQTGKLHVVSDSPDDLVRRWLTISRRRWAEGGQWRDRCGRNSMGALLKPGTSPDVTWFATSLSVWRALELPVLFLPVIVLNPQWFITMVRRQREPQINICHL